MPCFSASNPRFGITVKQQLKSNVNGRAKTATLSINTSQKPQLLEWQLGKNKNFLQDTRNNCEELLKVNSFQTQSNRRKSIFKKEEKKATLPRKELDRLKASSVVSSLEERLDALIKHEQDTKRMEIEMENLREHFKKMDDARKKAAEDMVQKEDLFGTGEKVKVLERAFLARHEQEDEVKRVNRIIMNAKCHAVRDAQLQEKLEMEKELRNDNMRLEKMVLERALQTLNEEDAKEGKVREKKAKYAREIRRQLDERAKLRFLEAERVEEEAKQLRKANEAVKRDEDRRAHEDAECKRKFREELNRIAEMSALFKRMLCEQEHEAEMRVAAYQREKFQREQELKREKRLAKEQFERKQQHIYTLAQKVLESHSMSEEMNYIRQQEKIEREYRQKEKEAARRKRQIEQDLQEARERQLQETKHRKALQIARAEQDFNNLVKRVKQDEEKYKQQDEQRERQRKCYRQDIIKQMNDKELERRRQLEYERNQASIWRESERQREANIRAVVNAKLQAMRDACLPEKYIKDVEKQLQKIASSNTKTT